MYIINFLPGCLLDPKFSSNVVLLKSFFRSVCFYYYVHSLLSPACCWVHQFLFYFYEQHNTCVKHEGRPDSAWPGLNVTVRIWPYQNKTEEKRRSRYKTCTFFKDAYIKRLLSLFLSLALLFFQDVICGSNEVWRGRWTIHTWLGGRESQQARLTSPISLTPGTPPQPNLPPSTPTQGSRAARREVASATLTSLWRLYLRRSAWELARATDININKACCWGPPVRGCHRRGQRRDASALTSGLISLSVRPAKKSGD